MDELGNGVPLEVLVEAAAVIVGVSVSAPEVNCGTAPDPARRSATPVIRPMPVLGRGLLKAAEQEGGLAAIRTRFAEPLPPVSPATRKAYVKDARNLLRTRRTPADAACPATYWRWRAALLWVLGSAARRFLTAGTEESDAAALVLVVLFHRIEAQGRPPGIAPARKSKRRHLAALPPDWRERLARHMPASLEVAYAVAALSGCRPAELQRGVTVMIAAGRVMVAITGAKTQAAARNPKAKCRVATGQPLRALSWEADAPSPFLECLRRLGGGSTRVTAHPDTMRSAFRDAALRAFPRLAPTRRPSPYSLRHAAASDLRSDAGTTDETTAVAPGHRATSTQTMYGRNAGRRRKGALPLPAVRAAVPVRSEKMRAAPSAISAAETAVDGDAPMPRRP